MLSIIITKHFVRYGGKDMSYDFKGWNLVIQVPQRKLNVIIDREEKNVIIFDEDKDLFAWIYPSTFGEGLTFEKMSWSAQFHVLHEEKKIIITSSEEVDTES